MGLKLRKKLRKRIVAGIAFPVCISTNNCICHFSPLRADPPVFLAQGDLIKIDLGAHVDGYCSVAAYSMVIGATPENPAYGKKADAILAAYMAAEAAMRTLKPGGTNEDVTEIITKTAEQFKCKPVSGMLSHQLMHNTIEGPKTIVLNPTDDMRREHDPCTIQVHEVYGVDVVVSTGEGKYKEMDARTTVFKRDNDMMYNLKMKTSRQFLTEVDKKFENMAFTLRLCSDEKKARLGVIECVKHDLINDFKVLCEKPSEVVAQFKFTVLVFPDYVEKLNHPDFDLTCYKSEHVVQDEGVKAILAKVIDKSEIAREKEEEEQAAWDDLARALETM